MNIVVCVDDNFGMLFNNRRVSSDIKIIEDINKNIELIHISKFSEKLFDKNYSIEDTLVEGHNFVEDKSLENMENIINSITIYYFNRKYPSDLKLKLNLNMYELISETQFEGNSHKKITKKVFRSK